MHNHSSFVVQKQEVGAIHTEPDVMSKTETNEPRRTHTQLIIFKKKKKTYEHHFMYSHFFMQVIFFS